jgi:hypothetical protein
MLYQYWAMLGIGAFIFTILSFLSDRYVERVGKLFYFLAAAITWGLFALGSLQITWRGGDYGTINFTYIPTGGEAWLALIPGSFSLLMFILLWFHAIEYFVAKPIAEEMDGL